MKKYSAIMSIIPREKPREIILLLFMRNCLIIIAKNEENDFNLNIINKYFSDYFYNYFSYVRKKT